MSLTPFETFENALSFLKTKAMGNYVESPGRYVASLVML
jgi:hypothetical protein